ncbi:MAG: hypothetical protein D6725_16590 [Planctomycetota bacterium]|nr:MAG: hypothetical protein D6725_16590 [Planctomycetota bacterium]
MAGSEADVEERENSGSIDMVSGRGLAPTGGCKGRPVTYGLRGMFGRALRALLCPGCVVIVPGIAIAAEQTKTDDAQAVIANDEVDGRAPRDPSERRLLERLDYFLGRRQWDEAYRIVAHFLTERRAPDPGGDPVTERSQTVGVVLGTPYLARTEGGHYVPFPQEVLRRLERMPEELQQRFRRDFTPLAERWLRRALAERDWGLLEEVAERFLPLPVGQRAAGLLVVVYTDGGDPALAAYWARRLLQRHSAVLADPGVRAGASAALRWLGDDAAVAKLREIAADADERAPPHGDGAVPDASETGADGVPSAAGNGGGGFPRGGDSATPRTDATDGKSSSQRGDRPAARAPEPTAAVAADSSGVGPAAVRMLPYGDVLGNDVVATAGTPVLVPRWSVPTARTLPVQRLLKSLHRVLSSGSLVTFPAWMPVCAGRYLVAPTASGVVVLDRLAGRPLYHLTDEVPAEAIINGQLRGRVAGLPAWLPPAPGTGARSMAVVNPQSPTSHPAAFFAWRNTVYPSVALDPSGEHFYWLRRHAVLLGQGAIRRQGPADASDPFGRDYDSNQLVRVAIDTGRIEWVAGGPEDVERLAGPLAGMCFLGPPVIVGRRAYIIGEKRQELRLCELDAVTGVLRWSVLLAHTSVPIGNDPVRRLFGLRPVVHGGILICPTHVGFVTAVNPRTRRVLWVTRVVRMSPESANPSPRSVQQALSLGLPGSEWQHARPIAVGSRILLTPQEVNIQPVSVVNGRIVSYQSMRRALCLRLLDGAILWQRSQRNAAHVAGVVDDRAIVLEHGAVVAWDVRSGKEIWKAAIDSKVDKVVGRGVLTRRQYVLPTVNGGLLVVDLDGGGVRKVPPPAVRGDPLGNLIAVGEQWISCLPWKITAYESRESLKAVIEAANGPKALSPEQRLRLAMLQVSEGQWQKAVDTLEGLPARELTPELRTRRDEVLRIALERLVLRDPQRHQAEIERLEELLKARGEADRLLRLQVERMIAAGQRLEAWRRLLTVPVASPESSARIDDERKVRVGDVHWTPATWVEARAAELWEDFSPERRTDADDALRASFDELGSPDRRVARARQFWFTNAGQTVLRSHIERLLADERFGQAEAEAMWLAAAFREPPDWLVQLRDAVREALVRKHVNVVGRVGGRRRPSSSSAANRSPDGTGATAIFWDWSRGKPHVQLRFGGYLPVQQVRFPLIPADPGTYFETHAVMSRTGSMPYVNASGTRLHIYDLVHDRTEWMRTLPRAAWVRSNSGATDFGAVGNLLFVFSGQVLRCLSPIEQHELWSAAIESWQWDSYSEKLQGCVQNLQRLRPWWGAESSFESNLGRYAWLLDAGPIVVVTAEPNGLVGRDTRTGRVRWRRPLDSGLLACSCWRDRVQLLLAGSPGRDASASRNPAAAQSEQRSPVVAAARLLVLDARSGRPLAPQRPLRFGGLIGRSRWVLSADVPKAGRPDASSRGKETGRAGGTAVGPAGGGSASGAADDSTEMSPGADAARARPPAVSATTAGSTIVKLWDPLDGTIVWSRTVAGGCKVAGLNGRWGIVGGAKEGISVVDLQQGRAVRLQVPPDWDALDTRTQVAVDRRYLYLFPPETETAAETRRFNEFPESRPIGGRIAAFELTTGKLVWRHEGPPTYLALGNPAVSPVLVLARRESRSEQGVDYVVRTIELIDKATGNVVWKQAKPVASVPNLTGLSIDLAARSIELWSYRERIRISPGTGR